MYTFCQRVDYLYNIYEVSSAAVHSFKFLVPSPWKKSPANCTAKCHKPAERNWPNAKHHCWWWPTQSHNLAVFARLCEWCSCEGTKKRQNLMNKKFLFPEIPIIIMVPKSLPRFPLGKSPRSSWKLIFRAYQGSLHDVISTSSTAQGGGGSFKMRKTIGEIGCCESRMSKQKHWPTD